MCAEGRDSDVGEGTKDSKTTMVCALCKTCVLTFDVPSGVIQLKRHLTVPTFYNLLLPTNTWRHYNQRFCKMERSPSISRS